MRAGVRRLFESHPSFEVCGEAENGREALEKAGQLKPDLVVLDLSMPVMSGLDAAPLLRKMLPNSALILLTAHNGPQVDQLSRAAGIQAVVPKSEAAARLVGQAQALLE